VDALLALIFVVTLVISGVVLYLTLWVGSVALLVRPQWVARRVVYRFWPERQSRPTAIGTYRSTGAIGLTLALIITWVALLEVLPR
jgi:hypothetical protein